MPSYDFKHPDKEEYVEVFFRMNEQKQYIDTGGVEWNRVFYAPNLNATNRSYDPNKPILDEKGNPMKVVPITDELVKSQGFDNAADYIEFSNSMVDETKTPLANLEKAHEQAKCKNIQEMVKENEVRQAENLKKRNEFASKVKKSDRDIKIEVESNRPAFDGRNSSHSSLDKKLKSYDNYANDHRVAKIKVNDKVVSEVKPKKTAKKSVKKKK